MASKHCRKELGVTTINFAVIMDVDDRDDLQTGPRALDMLKLFEDAICEELDEHKVEVSGPNFTTQRVSSRRDVGKSGGYLQSSPSLFT
jgi:hypothetical protein